MNKLSWSKRILVATTLFGMFFGAGNLIFPIHLGQLAGNNYILAIIGFCITAVGIPILAVAAIGNTHSSGLQELASRVSNKYGAIFTLLLYLTIGPFFAIPRCATVSYTTGIEPLIGEDYQWLALLLFSLIFFILVLIMSLKNDKITLWIGKIINPLFLIFLFVLIIVCLFSQGGDINSVLPDASYQSNTFFNSFIEGYGTMDAIAGLAFGILVIEIIKGLNIKDDSKIAKEVIISGSITAILMLVIYALTIIMGVKSRTIFELSENGGIAFREVAYYYLGNTGSIILAITITLACLKTSIGLVTACSETFTKLFKNKISYKKWVYIITIFAFIVSNIGLSQIINYSLPVLMFLYPLAITLTILALSEKLFNKSKYVYCSVTIFTGIAAFFDLIKTLPSEIVNSLHLQSIIDFVGKVLPLYDLNLGWIIPALIGLIIGIIITYIKNKKILIK